MFEKTKQRFIDWVVGELEARRQRQVNADITLDPTSVIAPEAEINNFAGGRERIRIGEHTYVRARLQTYGHGGHIDIGDWCYLGIRTEVWAMDSITIGNRVLIAHDVNIHDGTAHSQNAAERHAHFRHILEKGHPMDWKDMPGVDAAPVVIEDDVWISFCVTKLKGVRIGAGSIVSAGSLVTEDVPPGVIYRCEKKSVITPLN